MSTNRGNVAENQMPSRFNDAPKASNAEMIEWDTPGQIVVGFIRHSKLVNGANGPYRVLTLETDAGMRAVIAGAILSDLLAEVPADSEVCITYLGVVPGGRSKNFELRYLPPSK